MPGGSGSCGTTSGCRIWPTSTGTPCRRSTARCWTGSPPGLTSSTCSGRCSVSSGPPMPTLSAAPATTRGAHRASSAPTWSETATAGGCAGSCSVIPPTRGHGRRWRHRAPAWRPGTCCWPSTARRAGGPGGPAPLRVGAAGKPVELTVAGGNGQARSVAVVPLRNDMRLRYLDWVRQKRAEVHEAGGGRVGYLHVPDMVSNGWADFLRDLRSEMLRDAIIVDVRSNSGGHTSELVIERLNRRLIGWGLIGGMRPGPYPDNAPR